jgi:hypothetical protein
MRNTHDSSLFTRGILVFIAIVQIILGAVFLLSPGAFPALLGFPAAPAWTDWMFAMLGARALGFAYGMIVAQSDLRRHASWLIAMIGVQALDWIATVLAVYAGKVTLTQVSTASFLPILFIAVIAAELMRRRATEPEAL